jgi:dethiobiotin synthetase
MKTIFITGTDTGVGKTTVSASLAAFLSLRKRMNVGVMKPFETGLPKDDKDSGTRDAFLLRAASGSADNLSDISPYTFEAPLAPEIAADLEHAKIDLRVLDRAYKKIAGRHDIVVVEGAGGIMVPIKKKFFYVDLIERWNAPVIIIARLAVGTINHTLLTYDLLKKRGIKVIGVILNNNDKTKSTVAQTNLEMLKYYLTIPVLGIYPYSEGLLRPGLNRALLADIFTKHIDSATMLREIENI